MDYKDYLKSENVKFTETDKIFSPTKLGGGGYSCNPYIGCTHNCLYCYAKYLTNRQQFPGVWGCYLLVKKWSELPHPSIFAGKHIVFGTMTDPYNHLEPFFKNTYFT